MSVMPCGGDAYRLSNWWKRNTMPPACIKCELKAPETEDDGWDNPAFGKCLGPEGYRWLALVASEVAAERDLRIRRLEGRLRSREQSADLWAQAWGRMVKRP